MKSQYRVVVIGGGVVGASVLYHLSKFGWTDIALVERSVLTAGSSWHAAGGIHALNADPNMAALQAYTIDLLKEIEVESGQSIGLNMTGGVTIACAPERWDWLQSAWRTFQTVGIDDTHLMTPDEIRAVHPDVHVEFRIAEGLRAWADRVLVRELLANLLDNAAKFSSRVDGATVELGREGEGGRGAFFVRDNGAGFDMEFADKLFVPFHRLHASDEFPGTGVGLATVHRIVQRHRGEIWAASSVGQGATFYFTLSGS